MGYKNRDYPHRKNISENKFQRVLNNNLHTVGEAAYRRGKWYQEETFSTQAVLVNNRYVYARFICKVSTGFLPLVYHVRFDLENPVACIRFTSYNTPVPAKQDIEEEREIF